MELQQRQIQGGLSPMNLDMRFTIMTTKDIGLASGEFMRSFLMRAKGSSTTQMLSMSHPMEQRLSFARDLKVASKFLNLEKGSLSQHRSFLTLPTLENTLIHMEI